MTRRLSVARSTWIDLGFMALNQSLQTVLGFRISSQAFDTSAKRHDSNHQKRQQSMGKDLLSRRAALLKLGAAASASYLAPALTTMSMAQAGSKSSDASKPSKASEPSKASKPSKASEPSKPSEPSKASSSSSSSGPSRSKSSSVSDFVDGLDLDATTKQQIKNCANSRSTVSGIADCLSDAGISVSDIFPNGIPLK